MAKQKTEIQIPSWIFFAVLQELPGKLWDESKQSLAERLVKQLQNRFLHYPELLEKLMHFEKNDSLRGYMMMEPKLDK